MMKRSVVQLSVQSLDVWDGLHDDLEVGQLAALLQLGRQQGPQPLHVLAAEAARVEVRDGVRHHHHVHAAV